MSSMPTTRTPTGRPSRSSAILRPSRRPARRGRCRPATSTSRSTTSKSLRACRICARSPPADPRPARWRWTTGTPPPTGRPSRSPRAARPSCGPTPRSSAGPPAAWPTCPPRSRPRSAAAGSPRIAARSLLSRSHRSCAWAARPSTRRSARIPRAPTPSSSRPPGLAATWTSSSRSTRRTRAAPAPAKRARASARERRVPGRRAGHRVPARAHDPPAQRADELPRRRPARDAGSRHAQRPRSGLRPRPRAQPGPDQPLPLAGTRRSRRPRPRHGLRRGVLLPRHRARPALPEGEQESQPRDPPGPGHGAHRSAGWTTTTWATTS